MTSLSRGWLHLASGAGVGRIFGFASNLLLSRWLGPTDLGLLNLVTTTVQTSDTLVRCGGDYALNFELGGQSEAIHSERGVLLARALVQLCFLTTSIICLGVGIWLWFGQSLFTSSLAASHRFILTGLLIFMIACEGNSASAWEVLLVGHRTRLLALRQGLFFPLRLLCAALGASFGGVLGAMAGWSLVALIQCFWLRSVLGHLWNPFHLWPLLWSSLRQLLKRGLPFYGANLLASVIFYPLLLKVSAANGLAEIGYLRVGQILQQIFAFLPSTFVPVFFLKLRGQPSYKQQVLAMEKPLRVIWLFLLEALLIYSTFDTYLIGWLFGGAYHHALLPTRLLLLTALLECLSQVSVQPLLAIGRTRLYGAWQNLAAVTAAFLGWFWIPSAGLAAYLIVRLLYVIIPLIGFGHSAAQQFQEPQKILTLLLVTIFVSVLFLVQILNDNIATQVPLPLGIASIALIVLQRNDLLFIHQELLARS